MTLKVRCFWRQAAVAAGLTANFAAATTAADAATTVRKYSPATEAGTLRPGLSVELDNPGECFTTGRVRGAYRCITRSSLYDPCFIDTRPADSESVLCVNTPWDRSAIRLPVNELPDHPPISVSYAAQHPWALELPSGARCVAIEGASTAIGRFRANYACGVGGGPRSTLTLYGTPNRTRPTWTIRATKTFRSTKMIRIALRTAWR